jgi:hypothetical protein
LFAAAAAVALDDGDGDDDGVRDSGDACGDDAVDGDENSRFPQLLPSLQYHYRYQLLGLRSVFDVGASLIATGGKAPPCSDVVLHGTLQTLEMDSGGAVAEQASTVPFLLCPET